MPVKVDFSPASATSAVLAKIGNPQREEPLQTSRSIFRISEADQTALTALFLKPFKNLMGHRFTHHSSLDQHEMNNCATAIFESEENLLDKGCEIARRLYAKSNHPNIKSGDLCVALIEDIAIEDVRTQALCILKSETVVPFLSISTQDGDLQLCTQQGINPEKIDKGCLIINHWGNKGYYVLTFDRSGETRFWFRDFLGVSAVPDSAFLTNTYTKLAVASIEAAKEDADESPPWETANAAKEALEFFENRENFDLKEFETEVLKSPQAMAKFNEQLSQIEEEQGQPLDQNFEISKKDVNKAKKKISTVVKLDTGVEIHVKPTAEEPVLERGFDDAKGMKYIKVYFNKDLTVG